MCIDKPVSVLGHELLSPLHLNLELFFFFASYGIQSAYPLYILETKYYFKTESFYGKMLQRGECC